ncbi:UNKNOWN [Stylonychia lemnae]|uniref:Pas domain s-box family protein n=1 Tax=Stylonychia lemnae TaxID=5949 RepID=A0A078A3E2_STYLE|nr:UNKNOWN [Stylonychia lemnae]|eukprot:CDW76798.1 UNKNOWN [Stylonychia lemnae]
MINIQDISLAQKKSRSIKAGKKNKYHQVINHFFNDHLNKLEQQDYKLFLLKIFFTLLIRKNENLAHFQIIDMLNHSKGDNFMIKNIKIIHIYYFESIILEKNQSDTSSSTINVQEVIESNRLMTKFENYLHVTSEQISLFWKTLQIQKLDVDIYRLGIKITKKIDKINSLYNKIESKLSQNVDQKLYLYMAAFYKFVVFKSKECLDEMQKHRNSQNLHKMFKSELINAKSHNKGIIVADFDFKKPMSIRFINKNGTKLTKYDSGTIQRLKINVLMPNLISDNHHLFISKFFETGKSNVLNKERIALLKQKKGNVVHITLSIFINFLNYKSFNMFFDLAEEVNYNPFIDFQDQLQQPLIGYLVLDDELKVYEFSKNCKQICGLSQKIINKMQDQSTFSIHLEDLFQLNDSGIGFKERLFSGFEYKAIAKYEEGLIVRNETILMPSSRFNINDDKSGSVQNTSSQQRSYDNSYVSDFMIKCVIESFHDGLVKMPILYIIQNSNITFKSKTLIENQGYSKMKTLRNSLKVKEIQEEAKESINYESLNEIMDFHSQSSCSQSSASENIYLAYSKFTEQINQTNTPSTLKFVMQVFLMLYFVVLMTSVVEFILSFMNFKQSDYGLKVTHISLSRLSCFRIVRPVILTLIFIANGYQDNNNSVLDDRFSFYLNYLDQYSEDFRNFQVELESLQLFEEGVKLEIQQIDFKNQFYNKTLTPSQSIYYYLGQISDVIEQARVRGQSVFVTQNPQVLNSSLFNMPNSATSIEQQLYFLCQNQNHNIYNDVRIFTRTYDAMRADIASKTQYTATMTYICIGLIVACSFLVSPFTLKITGRTSSLINLFLDFSHEEINKCVKMVDDFLTYLSNETKDDIVDQLKVKAKKSGTMRPKSRRKSSKKLFQKKISESIKREDLEFQDQEEVQNLDQDEEDQSENSNDDNLSNVKEASAASIQEDEKTRETKKGMEVLRQKFKSQIRRKLIKYLLVILINAAVICSYFVIFYYISAETFKQLVNDIDVLTAIYSRKTSKENAIFGVLQTFYKNRTEYINGGQEEINYYLTRVYTEETTYQQVIVNKRNIQIANIQEEINKFETQEFCDHFFNNLSSDPLYNVTTSLCKQSAAGLAAQGLTLFFYQQVQNYQAIRVQFPKLKRSLEGIKKVINDKQFLETQDVQTRILSKPWLDMQKKALDTILEFNYGEKVKFIVMFTAFIVLLFVIIILFIASKLLTHVFIIFQKYSEALEMK